VPVEPRPAATVVLLRDAPDGLQVFLQRRATGMAFAGGVTVFPGGGVDAQDRPDPARWEGPAPAEFAARLACDEALAGAFVQAAVRETFEECGVLLAGPALPAADVLREGREALVARTRTLADLLAGADLAVRADLLRPWARWITPPPGPKRYDTAFFVAAVPAGQEADAHTTEAVEAAWWRPEEALAAWGRRELRLMPPTTRALQELAELPGTAAVLAAAGERAIEPITPRMRRDGENLLAVLPDGVEVLADGPALGAAR
jgi:8-oxo-dGTP pyrophosphatase MutT (NUDIX family)